MPSDNEPRPYQVCLYVGDNPPVIEGVKVVDLTPASATSDAVVERFKESGLTPSDLRARVYVHAEGDRDRSLAVYAALVGFAGRRLDLQTADGFINLVELDATARRLADAGRPAEPIDHLQLGTVAHPEIPSITTSSSLRPADVSAIKYARRLRLVPSDDATKALSELTVIAAIRRRGDGDRLPFLCVGDEPVVTDDPGAVVGLCLDTIRRAAVELRRSLRSDDREAIAEVVPLTARQERLLAAAALPIEQTLVRLGASPDESNGLWHCPRPDRHTNGDKNASMRSVKEKVQCMRCDPERVDSLRLVMDALDLSADESAAWLANPANRRPAHSYAA